ncbi:MAG TPA: aldo/keto reductase [Sphingobium sp.]|nr:aldo/keto reductase [Sphingobium sp.]
MVVNRRPLAGTSVCAVGLGCMNLNWAYGVPPPHEDKARLLNEALDLGYGHLDTANIYGMGANEELIGEAISHRRAEFLLASKTGIVVDGARRGIDCHPDSIARSLDESLRRLRTDRIDLFYMHRFDPKVPIADSVGAMARAIEAGKIGAYGVSEWSAAHIREAHAVHPMAAVQTEYSLWTRNVELAVLETTRALGIAFVAFSPLARGVLAGAVRDLSVLPDNDLRRAHPRFLAENWSSNLRLADAFAEIARDQNVAPAQLALAWVLSRGEHVHVIPGTVNPVHAAENIARADWRPDDSVLDRVDALINHRTVSGPRYPEGMMHTIDTEEFAG